MMQEIIRKASKISGVPQPAVRKAIYGYGQAIIEACKEATVEEDVYMKIFHGIYVTCTFEEKRNIYNPKIGETVVIENHYWPRVRSTAYFRQTVNGKITPRPRKKTGSIEYHKMIQRMKENGVIEDDSDKTEEETDD